MRALENANARRLSGARANKLTDVSKVRRAPRDVNATYGPPELCACEVERGVFWIQTTDPQFSRKLETRSDMRRVELVGVKLHAHARARSMSANNVGQKPDSSFDAVAD